MTTHLSGLALPRFVIDEAVARAAPDFVRHVVIVDIDTPLDRPLAADTVRRAAAEARVAAEGRMSSPLEDARLMAWRDAFAEVGMEPSTYRPAHEALLRRALEGRDVVLGEPLVDAGNAVSLAHRVPVGVHDLAGFDEVVLRPARRGDEFTALDGSRSDPEPGEVVFAGGSTVLTRRWVWRQGVAGSFRPDSSRAFVNVDLLDGRDDGAVAMLRALVEAVGGRVAGEIVVEASPIDPLLGDLRDRGVVRDCTSLGRLSAAMRAPLSLYCGIDPTAPSLHVGSLLVFATLRRFRAAGHRPIVVVGGATGSIGDPSGRRSERSLLDHATLDANVAGMRPQIERLLAVDGDGPAPVIVDNREWIAGMDVLEFCREVGAHFRVGEMLGRESVRTRLESPQGLSFTEFSYSLLQALDFKVLRARHDCRLQVGGSDQWGNIVAGVELIRRTMGLDAHGLTWPLLTKADGEKFGKSAGDNIWLNAELTSTWAFWQFWLNQTDDDAATLLRLLSWRSVADVDAVLARHGEAPSRRHAQRALADEMTEWVHGLHSLASVHSAVEVLFGSRPGGLDAEVISVLADQIPTVRLSVNELSALDLPGLLVRLGAADTRAGASRLLASGGIAVNSQVAPDKASRPLKLVENGALLVRRGKRSHFLAIVEAPCERRCHTDARAAARPQPAGSPTVDDGKQR